MKHIEAVPVLVMLFALLISGVGSAAAVTYILGNSNVVTVTVNDVQATITPILTVSVTNTTVGQSITLYADCGLNYAGKPVNFYDGTTRLNNATILTDANGKASLTITPFVARQYNFWVGP